MERNSTFTYDQKLHKSNDNPQIASAWFNYCLLIMAEEPSSAASPIKAKWEGKAERRTEWRFHAVDFKKVDTSHRLGRFRRRKIISTKCHRKSSFLLFLSSFFFSYSGSNSIKYLLKNKVIRQKGISRWNRMWKKKNLFLISPLNQKRKMKRFQTGAWCDFHLISWTLTMSHVPCSHLTENLCTYWNFHLPVFIFLLLRSCFCEKIKPSHNVLRL